MKMLLSGILFSQYYHVRLRHLMAYPLFPTAYFKKLVDNITIQQTEQNKHIIILLASPTFTISLHREPQREKKKALL